MIIDAHTHILYDIDDGAKDISESLRLIQLEIENDVDIIVLTPHFDPYNDSAEIFTKKRREHYDILSQNIRDKNDKNDKSDKNITLILGSETLYSPLLMYYSTLEPLCISGTRFILIEFVPDMKFGRAFFDEFNKLIIKFDIIVKYFYYRIVIGSIITVNNHIDNQLPDSFQRVLTLTRFIGLDVFVYKSHRFFGCSKQICF